MRARGTGALSLAALLSCVVACSTTSSTPATKPTARSLAPSPRRAGVVAARAPRRLAPGWLPEGVRPLRYALDLQVDPRQPGFSGSVRIRVAVDRPTRRVHIHARGLSIARAVLGASRRLARVERPSDSGAEPAWGERVLVFAAPLSRGEHELRLRFSGRFDKRLAGLYRAQQGGRHYAYTQFEAADARKAFPCFDEPRFKVPFDVTLRVPRSMRAFANTPRRDERVEGDTRVLRFERTKALPTYLVAFVIGDLDVVDGGRIASRSGAGLPLRALVPRGKGSLASGSLALTRALLPVLERYFGRAYPYRKLDIAALVAFGSGAMENAGLITFRESGILYDSVSASAQQVRRTAWVIAHELSHQWFGNLVTMRWWDDLWLNEAFATWMSVKAVDAYRPELRAREGLRSIRSWVYDIDALRSARAVRQSVRSVSQAEAAFDGLTYIKGASVLDMLEAWAGPRAFQRGVQAYLARHAFGNATAADLFRALEAATKKPVGRVARTFLDRPGVPLVQAELRCERGRAPRVLLEQRRYQPLGAPALRGKSRATADAPWAIPICVAYATPRGSDTRCTLLDKPRGELSLSRSRAGCPAWIHPNAAETGYYHWSLPAAQLSALASATRRAKGSPSSAAAIIENTWYAVAAGRSKPRVLYKLLRRFRGATNRRLVAQIIGVLQRVRRVFEPARASGAFGRFVRATLRPSLAKLGLEPRRGEPPTRRMARVALYETLGVLGGDRRVIAHATGLARRYVAGTAAATKKPRGGAAKKPQGVAADLAPVALRVALAAGKLTPRALRSLLASPLPTVRVAAVRALSMVAAAHVDTALDWLASGVVGTQNTQRVLEALLRRPELQRTLYARLETRLPALQARMPSFGRSSAARLPGALAAVCDAELRARAAAVFRKHATRGSEHALAQGEERSASCVALRRWAGAEARRYDATR
ncbi:MAG: M1 family metallopeptidase [Myxococcales bacterium]|nr:M1 family metallopeptidase [Myxococcales bacterium]